MLKNKAKLLITFLIIVFFVSFFVKINISSAGEEKGAVIFTPQVTIPGSIFEKGTATVIQTSTITIANYIKSIYNYLLAIAGLLAAIVLMASGIIWLTAAGNSEKISQAKAWMVGSLTGLVLMLSSYLILSTINPGLVDFKITKIDELGKLEIGCCHIGSGKDRDYTSLKCYEVLSENNTIQKIKQKELTDNWNNNIADYINSGSLKFDKDARTNANGSCQKLIYCKIQYEQNEDYYCPERYFKTFDNLCKDYIEHFKYTVKKGNLEQEVKGDVMESIQWSDKDWNDKDECFGKKDGQKCKNHHWHPFEGDFICYCFNGMGYINDGKINEPCGRSGKCMYGSSCPANYSRDFGVWRSTRSCQPGISCCN